MKIKINNLSIASLLFLTLFYSIVGISSYIDISIAGIDTYIGIAIGIIIGFIPLAIFLYLFNFEDSSPIYIKTKIIFGKILGTIINYLIIIVYLIIGIIILFNISNFVVSQYLTRTPILLIMIVVGLTSLYIATKGIKVIANTSPIFVVIIMILFVIGVSGIFSDIKLDNLKPFLEYGLKKPLLVGLINSIMYTAPIYMLLIIPKREIENNKKTNKYLIICYIVISVMIFGIAFSTSAVLGKYLLKTYLYPAYIALKRISILGFLDRIENLLSLQFFLSTLITISMIIYHNSKCSEIKKGEIIIKGIITLIMIIGAHLLFSNNTAYNNFLIKGYPYILLSLFIIYTIIFIGAIIRKKIMKKI